METNVTLNQKNAGFYISSPTGTTISIPETYDPNTDVFAKMKDPNTIRQYYLDNGFVIQRNLIPGELCDRVRQAFFKEVKSNDGFFYRQATGLAERHKFTDHNYMLNAVMNIQDLDRNKFGTFQHLGLKILTHQAIRSVLKALMHSDPIVA